MTGLWWRKGAGRLLDILLPPVCHLCRQVLAGGEELHLCPACRQTLHPVVSPRCDRCGQPFVSTVGEDHRCGACLTHPPPYTAALAAFRYEEGMKELIHRFKYGRNVRLRRPLALLMAAELAAYVGEVAPDLLVPVPLHRRRLRWRGFNQSVLLGEVATVRWGIPLCRDALRRVRQTGEQTALDARAREGNVRGAFEVARPELVQGRRILLLDDVYTTGSTVRECARVLKRSGSGEVFVATVARAP